jgi:hypothetical protein
MCCWRHRPQPRASERRESASKNYYDRFQGPGRAAALSPLRSIAAPLFEQRFSSVRMATDYVAVYRLLLERSSISERKTAAATTGIGKS